MWIYRLIAACLLAVLVAGREVPLERKAKSPAFEDIRSCAEPYGLQLYPHPRNCDQFYKCENGTLTLETCENGLLFDGNGAVHNHCNYHWAVNCYDRVYELIPDTSRDSSNYCEYAFGIFPISSGCNTYFYRCAYGEAEQVPCEKGLAYDERIHACNWPDLLLEYGCNPEEVVGFRCPDLASIPTNSLTRQFLPYPRYPVPGDCGRLVTCVDYHPRLLNCGYGSVFNEYTLSCDDPENVPACANYYK